jgi:hypothetical protein
MCFGHKFFLLPTLLLAVSELMAIGLSLLLVFVTINVSFGIVCVRFCIVSVLSSASVLVADVVYPSFSRRSRLERDLDFAFLPFGILTDL